MKEKIMKWEQEIVKWEDEIEKIAAKQKEMNQKCNEQIRDLRKKIQDTESEIRKGNNQIIAETVREIFGEVNLNTLEDFKQKMKSIQRENGLSDNGNSGFSSAVHEPAL